MMNINFADVIMVAVLAVFCAMAFLFKKHGVPYLTALFEDFKNSLDDKDLDKIKYWAGVFVKAAEMIFTGDKRGEEKKAYVLGQLEALGFGIGAKEDAIVEAEVYTMNNAKAGVDGGD